MFLKSLFFTQTLKYHLRGGLGRAHWYERELRFSREEELVLKLINEP